MERTISFMNGKGSIGHNTRSFIADNVDASRTKNNITLIHEDIKQVYHKLFDKALKEYNAKQKRKDRQVKSYYEKISRSKQEKLFYEVIVQIGNKDDTGVGSSAAEVATWVLKDYVKMFQLCNPQLYVIGAYIHLDEETPHLHLNFVPWVSGCKRGLETKTSLKAALATRGFVSEGKGNTEWRQWAEAEKDNIALIMSRYGIDWKKKDTHNMHLSVLDYKKKERAKEVDALEEEIEGAQVVLELKEERIESLEKEIESKRDCFRKEQSETQKKLDDTIAENHKLQSETTDLRLKNSELRLEYYENVDKLTDKQKEVEMAKKEADKWMMISDTAKLQTERAEFELEEVERLKKELLGAVDGDDYAGALLADESPVRHSRLFCTRWNGLTKASGIVDAFDDKEYTGSLVTLLQAGTDFVRNNSRAGVGCINKKDLSLIAEIYSYPNDEYIVFSEFPLGEKRVDFAIFSGRSTMDVTFIEIKGADFNLKKCGHYDNLNAKIEEANSQIRNHRKYIYNNYDSFRKELHGVRKRAESGENIYNAFLGPKRELQVDPNKNVNIRFSIVAGRTPENDIKESDLRYQFGRDDREVELFSWDSWIRRLSRD